MKLLIKHITIFSIIIYASIACEREIPFVLPEPTIIPLFESTNAVVQEPGKPVLLEFEIQATSGIKSFQLFKNDEPFDTAEELVDEISGNYTLNYLIPSDEPIGTQTNFEFILTDLEDRVSKFSIILIAGNTFTETEETINGTTVIRLKGRINGDYRFNADKIYLVDSTFSIEDGGDLIIDEGAIVYFKTYDNPNVVSRLVITRNSTINAKGTADNPIIFTSDKVLMGETPEPTDWGGIFIFGNAPTNQGNVILEDGFRYGGNNLSENSGTLSFVRNEYAGKAGFHGIHFFGVGEGTQVNNIQVFQNENIAFRVKGGGVNLKYIAGIGHGGYGLWAEHGWKGYGQFWIFQTNRQATLVPVNFWNQARSVELRSDETFFLTEPRTEFVISNVTLIGNGDAEGTENGTRRGVRIRRGAFGIFQNAIVTEFPDDAVRMEDLDVEEYGDVMILDNIYAFNNRKNFEEDAEAIFLASGEYNLSEEAVPGISINNFIGSVPSDFNPSTIDNWFDDAPFVGAVPLDGADWTSEGSWFKNIDGTIR
ncbi:MAG: hypothetical protein ACOCXH_04555 [Cyclobacteriaceae bacterium]